MSEIRVNTDELRHNAAVFKTEAQNLTSTLAELLSVLNALDLGKYQSQLSDRVRLRVIPTQEVISVYRDQLQELAEKLNNKALEFEQANTASMSNVTHLSNQMNNFTNSSPILTSYAMLRKMINQKSNAIWGWGGFIINRDRKNRIIRNVEVDGRSILLDGMTVSSGFVQGAGYSGEFESFQSKYGDGTSYKELSIMAELWNNGKLPDDWPDPKSKPLVDAKLTFFEHDIGTAQDAVFSGQAGSEMLGIDYSVISAEVLGSASAEINKHSLRVGAEGQAGIYLGKISGDIISHQFPPLGPVNAGLVAAGTAFVGAEVCGKAAAVFDTKSLNFGVDVDAEAFAGGKVKGEVEGAWNVAGIDGSVKASGSLNYGIGASAKADVGFNQDSIKVDIQAGLTLGLGFDAGISFELNTTEAVKSLLGAMSKASQAI